MKYLVIIEKGPDSFGAYVPDLPGCIAAGETREETLRQIHHAIKARIAALRNDNRPVPDPASSVELIEVTDPAN